MFRDQTALTQRRSVEYRKPPTPQKSRRPSPKTAPGEQRPGNLPSLSRDLEEASKFGLAEVTQEQQAFFKLMQKYVQAPQDGDTPSGLTEMIRSIYITAGPSSNIHLAVSATSNLLYGFLHGRKEQRLMAEMNFTQAVSLTRAALEHPTESKSDQTLIAVLLLTMYEVSLWTYCERIFS